MVRRGLASTRSEAAAAITSGKVLVGGARAVKPATLVAAADPITLSAPPRRFVSRGGEKLDAALDAFGIGVAGRDALDAGASTGGFTDALLQRGAARVVAVDVGYGQLDWRLREDPRVTVLERTNARELAPRLLPFAPDIVVGDLSFVSLRLVVPALARVAAPDADVVLLVKPQFEAGRSDVGRGGVVTSPEAWRTAVAGVADACRAVGWKALGVIASPLLGPAGNAEFLLWSSSRNVPGRSAFEEDLDAAVAAAVALRDRRSRRAGLSVGEEAHG